MEVSWTLYICNTFRKVSMFLLKCFLRAKQKDLYHIFSTIDVSEFQLGLNIEQARIFFAEKKDKPFRFDYTPTTDGSHFHIPAWSQHNRSKLPNALILKSALNRYGCRCCCHQWIKVWSTSLIWRGSRSIAGNFNKAPLVTCEFSTIIGRTFHFNAHPMYVCVWRPKNCPQPYPTHLRKACECISGSTVVDDVLQWPSEAKLYSHGSSTQCSPVLVGNATDWRTQEKNTHTHIDTKFPHSIKEESIARSSRAARVFEWFFVSTVPVSSCCHNQLPQLAAVQWIYFIVCPIVHRCGVSAMGRW